MQRREFLTKSSLVLGSSLLPIPALLQAGTTQTAAEIQLKPGDWTSLRKQFVLSYDYIHLATFLLASHPKPVADAIARHRQAFDVNPADYWHEHFMTIDADIAASAARYMGGRGDQIALTDSTTMGLAMVYSGLQLRPGDEVLQTVHDHYSTDLSLQLRAERTGAKVRQVALYDNPAQVSVDQVVSRLKAAINAATRVVVVTWVHSSTGVKLPLRAIAAMLAELNNQRNEADQMLFCVDGVHGFGIEDIDVSTIGCDFFIAGTHKWIFGPRGTGVVWGSDRGWSRCKAVIPSFSRSYDVWLGGSTQDQVPMGEHMTPGGFHSFEHRWALPEAFELHLQLGKAQVQQRIHQLNTLTKQGLQQIKGVTLHTPMAAELSSGLVCFDYKAMTPDDVVKAMHAKGIIMSSTPYRQSHARFAPSLINNEQEIKQTLAALTTF
ncbi:aminotransferase class V-fold PLP-dependent enzyme [Arsukibacterium sp.]|uniref:aminotransferase class V-fold PLP-dependent enzyme n=1 Tax=Arsukibacterium sp. TaxID=1977258 RepID=UPI00299E6A77|nr:aminotransferase class V-fold PLP-dependent enzyme [Arsukibacterium sp.]MDX1676731.1 aminotransferase class V-fold PLP-dependent enzyme [Arsukibacterium sp.]